MCYANTLFANVCPRYGPADSHIPPSIGGIIGVCLSTSSTACCAYHCFYKKQSYYSLPWRSNHAIQVILFCRMVSLTSLCCSHTPASTGGIMVVGRHPHCWVVSWVWSRRHHLPASLGGIPVLHPIRWMVCLIWSLRWLHDTYLGVVGALPGHTLHSVVVG